MMYSSISRASLSFPSFTWDTATPTPARQAITQSHSVRRICCDIKEMG
jgi:hypothetical protein